MSDLKSNYLVDAVITNYNEDIIEINRTISSCLRQSISFNRIFVIDDGSDNFKSDLIITHHSITILKLTHNVGIAAARNKGLNMSKSSFVACINVEIELDTDWLKKLILILTTNTNTSAVFGNLRPFSNSFYTKWRMRFHEQHYSLKSGNASFAPGHAVLFKRSFLDNVGLYNENLKLIHEDADICFRLKEIGTIIYYVHDVSVISYQKDNFFLIGKKHFYRMTLGDGHNMNTIMFLNILIKDHIIRSVRNTLKFRLNFLKIDFKVSLFCFKYYFNKV